MPPPAPTPSFAVKVTLSHASDLAASDFNGKSDPYVTFQVGDEKARSSCRPATCDPAWTPLEQFDFKISDPATAQLAVKVFDHDLITKDDLLGSVVIPLKEFLVVDGVNKDDAARAFALAIPEEFHRQQRNSQLFLAVRVIPLNQADVIQEMWENESWVVGKGWCSGEGAVIHHRSRWSSDSGGVSSAVFEQVAPKAPDGFESSGWSFVIGKGDPEGWFYATTFAGPWYNEKNAVSLVRRRKWTCECRRTLPAKDEGSPRHSETLK